VRGRHKTRDWPVRKGYGAKQTGKEDSREDESHGKQPFTWQTFLK